MAKRNSTRRRARKPKITDVQGHQLTEAMYADYQRCIDARGERGLEFGLDDFLSRYRPSRKAEQRLKDVYHQASRTALAVGSLQDYAFFTPDPEIVRAGGCDLLDKLALELSSASAKLVLIARAIRSEETTKLQDWLAMDERIARLGRREEVAHV